MFFLQYGSFASKNRDEFINNTEKKVKFHLLSKLKMKWTNDTRTDYTWWGVYRFDSSSVVIMLFLKASLFNDY